MAGFEDLHKERLEKSFADQTGESLDIEAALAKQGEVIEGGESHRKSPLEVVGRMKDQRDIFDTKELGAFL